MFLLKRHIVCSVLQIMQILMFSMLHSHTCNLVFVKKNSAATVSRQSDILSVTHQQSEWEYLPPSRPWSQLCLSLLNILCSSTSSYSLFDGVLREALRSASSQPHSVKELERFLRRLLVLRWKSKGLDLIDCPQWDWERCSSALKLNCSGRRRWEKGDCSGR